MYATLEEFKTKFSINIEDNEINVALQKASDNIDYLTLEKISNEGYDNLSAFRKEKIKDACLYATLHNVISNNYDSLSEGNVKSFKLGDLSISKIVVDLFILDIGSNNKAIRDIGSDAYKSLMRTGLMNTDISPKRVIIKDSANQIGSDVE